MSLYTVEVTLGIYAGGFDGALTVQNDAEGYFRFSLSFTYDDYLKASEKGFVDEDGCACFYYVIQEKLPDDAEDYFWNGVIYDDARYLVLIRLFVDGDQLKTERTMYPYDGSGIPEELPAGRPQGVMARAR